MAYLLESNNVRMILDIREKCPNCGKVWSLHEIKDMYPGYCICPGCGGRIDDGL